MKQSVLERTRIIPERPLLVDEAGLANWMGISERTLRRWRRMLIEQGDPLPVLWIDRGTWFSITAIEDFIQERLRPDTLGYRSVASQAS